MESSTFPLPCRLLGQSVGHTEEQPNNNKKEPCRGYVSFSFTKIILLSRQRTSRTYLTHRQQRDPVVKADAAVIAVAPLALGQGSGAPAAAVPPSCNTFSTS